MILKLETFFKHYGQRDIIFKVVRVNKVDKGKHIQKGDDTVRSSSYIPISVDKNAMEMEELSETEKNAKSVNDTKSKEKRVSGMSTILNALEKGLRVGWYY